MLRDGRHVHVMDMSPSDADRLRMFHSGLSERTVYQRFFSPHPHLSDADVAVFTDVDHLTREALIAESEGAIIGVGRFDALTSRPGEAEVAFVVTDTCQGQGVGSMLLRALTKRARECGIRTLVAEVLPANGRMIDLFLSSGHPVVQEAGDGVVRLRLSLESDSPPAGSGLTESA